jgi:CelD/BcsL family acetyltransferase involved in cellulose biosynthesis
MPPPAAPERPVMPAEVEWITERSRLVELATEWDALATGPLRAFLTNAWFRCWWDAFGNGRSLRTCAVWREGRLVAVFPLEAPGRHRLRALANVHSPSFRPLAADRKALGDVIGTVLSSCAQLEAENVPAGQGAVEALGMAARARGWPYMIDAATTSPVAELSGDLDRYRGPRKRRWREIQRRRRKLHREHATELRAVTAPVDLDRELEAGLRVEASGWKGRTRTAILSSARTASFYRSVARSLHDSGHLRLSSLIVDGKMIAFDLALVDDSRYLLLKTGYDERWRSLSPGLVLRLSVIERCFELGLDTHEFLGHDAEWKRLFATGARNHHAFRAYSTRPLPLARFAYRRTARPLLRRGYRLIGAPEFRRWLARPR